MPRAPPGLQPKLLSPGNEEVQYTAIVDRVDLRAVGLETLGEFGPSARAFFDDIGSAYGSAAAAPVLELVSTVISLQAYRSATWRASSRLTHITNEPLTR